MGEIDRSNAMKMFQESLLHFPDALEESMAAEPSPPANVPEPHPVPPTSERAKQLAAMEEAIADLEAFLHVEDGHLPSPED